MYTIEILHEINGAMLEQLLNIRKIAFSGDWKEYDDVKEFYAAEVSKSQNIALALKREGELVGFLLAMPHNLIQSELSVDDPQMPIDDNCFYVETMEISPNIQKSLAGGKMFLRMLHLMIEEAAKHNVKHFSMHAMVNSGLSLAVQRYFGKTIKNVRRIEHWKWNGYEPSDYIFGIVD
jgi:hypothetical protein